MTVTEPRPNALVRWFRSAWNAVVRLSLRRSRAASRARVRLLYDRFREILSVNDATLELIASLEDALGGRRRLSIDACADAVRHVSMDVFVMVKNLNLIDHNRHAALYQALGRINAALEDLLPQRVTSIDAPRVLPIRSLRLRDTPIAGSKMATLGDIGARTDLLVPDGFVVTAAAYADFMTHNELWNQLARLESILATKGPQLLAEACREVQSTIQQGNVPGELEREILAAFDALGARSDTELAVRSSAVGEDQAASHAGQYASVLHVSRAQLLDAWKRVLASTCSPSAIAYRLEQGLGSNEAWMAVGCMPMVAARSSGILFSRDYHETDADRVALSATQGIADQVASGQTDATDLRWEPGGDLPPLPPWLDVATVTRLADIARQLERLFGCPQDIEWALDPSGQIYVLQARRMKTAPRPAPELEFQPPEGAVPRIQGGSIACPGVASGPVATIRSDEDLEGFADGAVIVAPHAAPSLSQLMNRCAAMITEVGSPAGHLAILAREFDVPTIVGLRGALSVLRPGDVVTVDAWHRAVFDGVLPAPPRVTREHRIDPNSPAYQQVQRLARLVTPLSLLDPHSSDFVPQNCQSLHDVIRYVHEKAFAVMFRFGDIAASERQRAAKLDARLPFELLVYDLGGAVSQVASEALVLRPDQITSAPLGALLSGLLDTRLRWDRPRPMSATGFLSVVGESMLAPPPEAIDLDRVSYAVCSDQYMNFSTKAGYHFSTIDTYCGESANKNYIHFRFSGGGAALDRRTRRLAFLSTVLSSAGFRTRQWGDMLVARLSKHEKQELLERVTLLGRLILCARQLDMLMDSDSSVDSFAASFLRGNVEAFF